MGDATAERGRRRWSVEQLSSAILGTVVVSAVLAGASDMPLWEVVLSGFVAVLVYWIAEQYAIGLASRAIHGEFTRADRLRTLRGRFSMVEAAVLPLFTVLIAAIFTSVDMAVDIALVVAVLSLGALGTFAGHHAGMSPARSVLAGAFAAALGGVVVLLKLLIH